MGLQIAFWIFAVIAVGGGLIALFERSVVRSAFALFGTFLGLFFIPLFFVVVSRIGLRRRVSP